MSTWQKLILNIMEIKCYEQYNDTDFIEDGKMCKAIFDGIYCWPPTNSGILAVQPCSNNLILSSKQGQATKQCTENGTWLVHDVPNKSWHNLSECSNQTLKMALPEDIAIDLHPVYTQWIPAVTKICYVGYSVSFFALLISITILIKIKRLQCARNKLHVNLFFSIIMRIVMAAVKDGLFVDGTALFFEVNYTKNGIPIFSKNRNYSWVCKGIVTMEWYFILSNFNLMLMEGIYLHNLMYFNFFSEHNKVTAYCVLGWGLPGLFVILWVSMKIVYENLFCWTTNDKYINLFIDVPLGLTVVINFILFLFIVKILATKLNNQMQQRKRKYRKLLKATLILIPLFGVPHAFSLLFYFNISDMPVFEMIWICFDQTVASFQGFFAALLYCLLNNEVQIEVKRKYLSLKDRNDKEFRRSRTISNTQQFSLQMNEDDNENDKHVDGIVLPNF